MTAKPAGGCAWGWWSVARFGLFTVLIAGLFSALASPWVKLSWWLVFRRCVSIGAALSLWICTRWLEHRPLGAYGLVSLRAGKRDLMFGVILGAATLGILLSFGLATGACQLGVTPDRVRLWRTALGFLPAAALVGVLEELVFRGFLLQHLLSCSKTTAVLTSSLVYSLVHLKTTSVILATWLELGGLFLLGGILALSYLRTGRLYLAIGLHAALAYGARVNKLVVQFPDPSWMWLVGSNRLVNGLAGWGALMGMGCAIVAWTRRSRQGGALHANSA